MGVFELRCSNSQSGVTVDLVTGHVHTSVMPFSAGMELCAVTFNRDSMSSNGKPCLKCTLLRY